jgi:hypothetical protein
MLQKPLSPSDLFVPRKFLPPYSKVIGISVLENLPESVTRCPFHGVKGQREYGGNGTRRAESAARICPAADSAIQEGCQVAEMTIEAL